MVDKQMKWVLRSAAPMKDRCNEMHKVLELGPGQEPEQEQERSRKEEHAEVLTEEEEQQEAY